MTYYIQFRLNNDNDRNYNNNSYIYYILFCFTFYNKYSRIKKLKGSGKNDNERNRNSNSYIWRLLLCFTFHNRCNRLEEIIKRWLKVNENCKNKYQKISFGILTNKNILTFFWKIYWDFNKWNLWNFRLLFMIFL